MILLLLQDYFPLQKEGGEKKKQDSLKKFPKNK